jgi:prepilin-type N-terminal cleavage/methylation domain-containing protein
MFRRHRSARSTASVTHPTALDHSERARGFTLLEILIAVAIFSVVMLVVVSIFISGLKTRAEGAQSMALEREGGVMLERIMRGLYGKGGLREANSGTVLLGEDGTSIQFEVDRNTVPTKTRADDITSLIYLLNGDVYYKPDITLNDVQCISDAKGHVESLQFTPSSTRVDITIKLVSDLPATDRKAFIHLTKSVTMRN